MEGSIGSQLGTGRCPEVLPVVTNTAQCTYGQGMAFVDQWKLC